MNNVVKCDKRRWILLCLQRIQVCVRECGDKLWKGIARDGGSVRRGKRGII